MKILLFHAHSKIFIAAIVLGLCNVGLRGGGRPRGSRPLIQACGAGEVIKRLPMKNPTPPPVELNLAAGKQDLAKMRALKAAGLRRVAFDKFVHRLISTP